MANLLWLELCVRGGCYLYNPIHAYMRGNAGGYWQPLKRQDICKFVANCCKND